MSTVTRGRRRRLTTEPNFVTVSDTTYEIVTFRTHAAFPEAEVRRRAAAVQAWIEQQPGYRTRSLLRTADGEWVDIVQWDTLAHAQAAAKAIGTAKAAGAFMEVIDGPSVVMRHARVAFAPDAAA